MVAFWPAASIALKDTLPELTTLQVPTLAAQVPLSASNPGGIAAVAVTACAITAVLVSSSVTFRASPGPVQPKGSKIEAVSRYTVKEAVLLVVPGPLSAAVIMPVVLLF